LQPWRGEDLAAKRMAVIHAHGFGDSIMALRYVPLRLPVDSLLPGRYLARIARSGAGGDSCHDGSQAPLSAMVACA
jgi:hypothetical protein